MIPFTRKQTVNMPTVDIQGRASNIIRLTYLKPLLEYERERVENELNTLPVNPKHIRSLELMIERIDKAQNKIQTIKDVADFENLVKKQFKRAFNIGKKYTTKDKIFVISNRDNGKKDFPYRQKQKYKGD